MCFTMYGATIDMNNSCNIIMDNNSELKTEEIVFKGLAY